jgi:hypothetical protein
MEQQFVAPRALISYAWESRDHKEWIKDLAVRLRLDGVEILLDQWELAPGDELTQFMEEALRTGDAVLIVCSPSYQAKSVQRIGGVGYETSIITAELASGTPRRKFIPLLRIGEWKSSAPGWLLGSVYLDFRGDATQVESSYIEVLQTLHGRREKAPPVGSPPFPDRHELRSSLPASNSGSSPEAFVLAKSLEPRRSRHPGARL